MELLSKSESFYILRLDPGEELREEGEKFCQGQGINTAWVNALGSCKDLELAYYNLEKKEYDFPDYRFYRYTKEDIEQATFSSNMHLTKTEKLGIPIEEKKITIKDIKDELQNKNIILLRLNTKPFRDTKRNTSNYVVVKSYSDNKFQIVDPFLGTLSIPEEMMQESFESLETKKHRDHRMIIFSNN